MTAPMLVGLRDVRYSTDDLVLRLYELILTWPCPHCGGAYPCPCDKARLDLAQSNMCATLGVKQEPGECGCTRPASQTSIGVEAGPSAL